MESGHKNILTQGEKTFILRVAGVVVPSVGRLGDAEKEKVLSIIEFALVDKRPNIIRRFRLFLFLLRWGPCLFFFSRFDRLSDARQTNVLIFLESAPIRLVRTGVWGLKALIYMGYYGQPSVSEKVGYVPDPEGNEALRAGKGV